MTKLNDEAQEFIRKMNDAGFGIYRDSAAKIKTKKTSSQSSRKYVCPCCGLIIRATKVVRVQCMDCEMEMEEGE